MSQRGTGGLLRRAERYLEAHGVESPRADAEAIVRHVLGTDRAAMYARTEPLTAEQVRAVGQALCRRGKGTPLQHITGEQAFMDLTLMVGPGVFVPRPETEILVEAALQALPPRGHPSVAVDVGTGTGAVALALKRARPDVRVVATDSSERAVALARANAERAGVQVEILVGDLMDPVPADLRGRVDVMVSNPPYVDPKDWDDLPADVRADPIEALVGGTDVHARLVAEAPRWLRPGGWLVVEVGDDQGPVVHGLFEPGFLYVEVLPDLTGRDRVVRGRLPQ